MAFKGKLLIIGYGSVSRCALPLLLKHLPVDPRRITVMDYAPPAGAGAAVTESGGRFVKERLARATLGRQLARRVGSGDMIIDLAWNIGCEDIVQWCRDHGVMYINTSVELWDPYEGSADAPPTERTLYVRHMALRGRIAGWKGPKGATAVLDHGANPGLVSHFTKAALIDMAGLWLETKGRSGARRELIQDALRRRAFNELAWRLGVKVIHISERDTQISDRPKRLGEFVNTWSIEGFYEEGTSPAELGWGTHEKRLPSGACVHDSGPRNQICLDTMGIHTWVRSWVPCGEILGMVVRHGEAFTISDRLTVWDGGRAAYRPTVHYAYHPSDSAIVSLHELRMRGYRMQESQRIMNDEITDGRDELGCLLMGHDFKSWWIGSLLDIHEARRLAPRQNATTLQVAASLMAAVFWMMENPRRGVLVPDDLPHEFILKHAKPYLGPFVSKPVDWTPLKNWDERFAALSRPKPPKEDVWQFETFLAQRG